MVGKETANSKITYLLLVFVTYLKALYALVREGVLRDMELAYPACSLELSAQATLITAQVMFIADFEVYVLELLIES